MRGDFLTLALVCKVLAPLTAGWEPLVMGSTGDVLFLLRALNLSDEFSDTSDEICRCLDSAAVVLIRLMRPSLLVLPNTGDDLWPDIYSHRTH